MRTNRQARRRRPRHISINLKHVLIFDSPGNFLYRQKGQLKLDNTILEEFLPHLVYRSLKGLEDGYELGPVSTFAGITLLSTLGEARQRWPPKNSLQRPGLRPRQKALPSDLIRLIVRKAKRISSNIRQDFKTPEARKTHREEHEKFIGASKYSATVFQRMIDKIQAMVGATDPTEKAVLERGFF